MPAYDTPVTFERNRQVPNPPDGWRDNPVRFFFRGTLRAPVVFEVVESVRTWARISDTGYDLEYAAGGAIAITNQRRRFSMRASRELERLNENFALLDINLRGERYAVVGVDSDPGRRSEVHYDTVRQL